MESRGGSARSEEDLGLKRQNPQSFNRKERKTGKKVPGRDLKIRDGAEWIKGQLLDQRFGTDKASTVDT